jgi:hypothetical protein
MNGNMTSCQAFDFWFIVYCFWFIVGFTGMYGILEFHPYNDREKKYEIINTKNEMLENLPYCSKE